MKRKASLSLPAEEVYRAVLDPIVLAAWWDIDYATTGPSPLHVFEVEFTRDPDHYRFFGFITEKEPGRRLTIEIGEEGKDPIGTITIVLSDLEAGAELTAEWDNKKLDPLAEAFVNSSGHRRLESVMDQFLELLPGN